MKPVNEPGDRWMRYGSCQKRRDLGWIVDRPRLVRDEDFDEEATMAAICGRCPVLAKCAAYVTSHEVTAGFWAGRYRTRQNLLPRTGDAA